jgi:hypothetical protein
MERLTWRDKDGQYRSREAIPLPLDKWECPNCGAGDCKPVPNKDQYAGPYKWWLSCLPASSNPVAIRWHENSWSVATVASLIYTRTPLGKYAR